MPSPVCVAGPDLLSGQIYDTQYNYGGNLEDRFEGQLTATFHDWADALENGAAVRYGALVTTLAVYPNTNDGIDSPANTGNNAQTAGFDDSYSFTHNAGTAPDELKPANGSPAQKDPDELRPPTQTIVIVHIELFPVATNTDPNQYLVNLTKDQFEKRLKE